jgi:hypothetical protein
LELTVARKRTDIRSKKDMLFKKRRTTKMLERRRSTFVPATRSPLGVATMAEALRRQQHISEAEDYWREGQKVIAAERLVHDVLTEPYVPPRRTR